MKQDTHDLQFILFAHQDCISRVGIDQNKLRACFLKNLEIFNDVKIRTKSLSLLALSKWILVLLAL